jgi:hypothetical protein
VHRSIEILIGKLVTDEDFRQAFHRDPRQALQEASESGLALTDVEIQALLATDQSLWGRIASELDGRLEKASLRHAEERLP